MISYIKWNQMGINRKLNLYYYTWVSILGFTPLLLLMLDVLRWLLFILQISQTPALLLEICY
jgi:hypothetical protein